MSFIRECRGDVVEKVQFATGAIEKILQSNSSEVRQEPASGSVRNPPEAPKQPVSYDSRPEEVGMSGKSPILQQGTAGYEEMGKPPTLQQGTAEIGKSPILQQGTIGYEDYRQLGGVGNSPRSFTPDSFWLNWVRQLLHPKT